MVAALIFGLWYPGPYRALAGGTALFLLIAAVDVVMGPLLTLVVFNPAKPRRELRRDLGTVAVLQIAALAYGAWTMAAARPTHLAFEVDLFRVVTAADLAQSSLQEAPPELRRLPWTGPVLIGALPPRNPDEQYESIMRGLAGQHLAATPRYWVAFDTLRDQARAKAQPLQVLEQAGKLNPAQREALQAAARQPAVAQPPMWLPVVGRHATWLALLGPDGTPAAFVDIDPY